MCDVCGDNRFEIIERAKRDILNSTNIDTSPDEIKVLDSFLFRCWQMGWLDDYDDSCFYKYGKVDIHKNICMTLNNTYERKNSDYGDSFASLREEFPDAILIRLTDKLNRLKTLMRGVEQKVNDESIEDTLLDLANYCIMEVVERTVDHGVD